MTTSRNTFLAPRGDGVKGVALPVSQGITVNQGDLVWWNGTTLQQLVLTGLKDSNAQFFTGVADKQSNLGSLCNPAQYPNLYVSPIRAEWSGIWRFHTTPGDTYHELDQVFLGADSQTITNNVAAATGNVGIGGTFHVGDVVTITIDGIQTAYTVVAGATNLAGVAASVAAAINANPGLAGVASAVVDQTTNTQVDITAVKNGVSGNTITLTAAVSGGGATITATASGSKLTGGNANLAYPLGNIHFMIDDINTYQLAAGTLPGGTGTDVPVIIPAPILPALAITS